MLVKRATARLAKTDTLDTAVIAATVWCSLSPFETRPAAAPQGEVISVEVGHALKHHAMPTVR